jgi:hypothetical protein
MIKTIYNMHALPASQFREEQALRGWKSATAKLISCHIGLTILSNTKWQPNRKVHSIQGGTLRLIRETSHLNQQAYTS